MLFLPSSLRLSSHRLRRGCTHAGLDVGAGATWVTRTGSSFARSLTSRARLQRPPSVWFGATNRNLTTSWPSCRASPLARSDGGRGRGRGVAVGLIGTSALVVLVGGTVAYARYVDPALRDRLEKTDGGFLSPLPTVFSGWLLDRIFGTKADGSSKTTGKLTEKPEQQPISSKEKVIQSGLVHRKLAREAAFKEEAKPESPVRAIPSNVTSSEVEKAIAAAPSKLTTAVATGSGGTDVKDVARRIVSSDASVAAENEALGRRVRESVRDLESLLSSAIGAHEKAVGCVRSDSKEKSAALSAAEARAVEARAALQRIRDVVQEGRRSKQTSSNAALIEAEEVANKALYGLQKAEAEVTMAQSEAKVMKEYKKQADESRLLQLLPEENVGVTEEDARLQVDQLRLLLASQQKGEQLRVQKALEAQRQEYELLTGGRLAVELQRQQRDLEIEYHRKLANLSDDYEQEVLQQLRRQTAAHTDHLHDVVQAQQRQLTTEYDRRLEDHVALARHQFQAELAGSLGRLQSIDAGLKARAESDEATRRAQRLWVACQALRQSIFNGQPDATSWEGQRKPLFDEMAAVGRAAGDDDKFVAAVLNTVPPKAISDGVFTESALKNRFSRVNEACRKVALVGDQGGSLFRYAVSYFQSLVLIGDTDKSSLEDELTDRSSIDVDALDTYEILERARRCLDGGNLELALRYMNQLKGAPRVVARDWLVETRLFLEISQITDALLARAAATEVQSVAQ